MDSILLAEVTAALEKAKSEDKEVRRSGLEQLRDLSRQDCKVALFDTPGVVNVLLEGAVQHREPRAFGALANLAFVAENAERLFEWNGVVDAFIGAAQNGETNEIKKLGFNGLVNLAIAPRNRVGLFEWKGVVDVFIRAAQFGETSELKERGLIGLTKLCSADENQARLFGWEGVVDILMQAAQNGETQEIKEHGVRGLVSLAHAEETKVGLIAREGVVDVFLRASQNGSRIDVKESGLNGLANLAFTTHFDSKLRLFEWSGVMEAFVRAIREGLSKQVTETGLSGICSFTDSPQISERLASQWDILSWLKDVDPLFDYDVGIIYLNLAVSPSARDVLTRDEPTVEALHKLIDRNNKSTEKATFFGKLALAVVRGSDPKYLALDEADLRTLTKLLDGALRGVSVLDNPWPLLQPLVGLRYLTTVDRNRELLGTEWLIQLRLAIARALEDDNSYAVEMALSSLAQYSLDEKTLSVIKSDPDYLKDLKRVIETKAENPSWSLAINAASGIVFTLAGNFKVPSHHSAEANGQVMISYAWGPSPNLNKQLASSIEEYLKQSGYSVWRDEVMMKADIMQAMADAIASSEIILVLVNKNYMESANCKRELTFALNSKRKIIPLVVQHGYDHRTDGWLGVAIGSLLYYDISSPTKRNAELLAMITKELHFDATKKDAPKLIRAPSIRAPNVTVPDSADEVRAWAGRCGIHNDVVEELIRQEFVTAELLEDLAAQPASEMRALLGIDLSARIIKLQKELSKLFPK